MLHLKNFIYRVSKKLEYDFSDFSIFRQDFYRDSVFVWLLFLFQILSDTCHINWILSEIKPLDIEFSCIVKIF